MNELLGGLGLVLGSYVVGSTPFGSLIARAHGVDLRRVGSGNVGATNVGRALGRRWGVVCFLLDMLKGLAPVLAAGAIMSAGGDGPPSPIRQAGVLLAGFGAIIGHVFSFYLRFRGGRGVATSLGVVLGIYPYLTFAGLVALGVWIVVVLATRYVSLASVLAAVAMMPLFAAFNWHRLAELWPLGAFTAAMAALVIIRHRENIRRLVKGTENKIGKRRPQSEPELQQAESS